MVAIEVTGCYGKSLVATEVYGCYGKTMVAMESPWLLWKVNGCHAKTLVVMESQWLLMKCMVAIESKRSLWVSVAYLWNVTGCYDIRKSIFE
jgi:hypothetical protein